MAYKRIRILAVDDDVNALKVIASLFKEYDVITEANSLNAAELIRKEKFDIFIIDYQMPNLDGIELLEEINKVYRNIPYVGILCTAYGTTHIFKEEFNQNLFSFFMEKPFNIDSFINVIERAVISITRMREGG